MKKVRLFAVAAAMGMFAATVNAAAPKVTKDTFVGTWGEMETVVKAEFGGKVVLPTANISVTKQTMSTDKKYAPKVTGTYGVGELKSQECYVGFTSEIGKDTNNDGIVDMPLMVWGNLAADAITGVNNFWYHDDAKYFPTAKTSLYYFGMTSNGYGARFLAPNQEARDGVIVVEKLLNADEEQLNYHGWYENTAAGNQQLVDMYVKAGLLVASKNSDGEIIGYKTLTEDATTYDSKNYREIKLTATAVDYRDYTDVLNEEVVRYVTGLSVSSDVTVKDYVVAGATVSDITTANQTPIPYKFGSTTVSAGDILIVKETRNGIEIVQRYATGSDISTVTDANDRPIRPNENGVKLLFDNGRYGFELYNNVNFYKYKKNGEAVINEFVWSNKSGAFVAITDSTGSSNTPVVLNSDIGDQKRIAQFGGAYRVKTPKNDTGKYVVMFDLGAYDRDLTADSLSTSKGTMTFTYENAVGSAKEVVVPAVKLGSIWYPAFANEADLMDFVGKMTSYREASEEWFDAKEELIGGGKRTWVNGTSEATYVPQNHLDHYKAKQCAFSTGEAVAVNASDVTVTSDISAVDVNKGGVYTAKLVASVGGVEVGTKDITVVVAPKYVREYKNGKVVSLKAYHLNGGLYSHTSFDYAKNTSTAVFYAQDGVTAVETVTSTIK